MGGRRCSVLEREVAGSLFLLLPLLNILKQSNTYLN